MNPVPLPELLRIQHDASALLPGVGSWDDLVALPTADLPLPIFCVWIDTSTGFAMKTRLLASDAAEDHAAGVYYPRDWNAAFPRAWFQAG